MKFKFSMNNKKFASNMEKRAKKVGNELDKALLKSGYLYQGAVKKGFPVDSGYGRSSVAVKRGKHFVTVGTNVKYVPYLEKGTGIYAENGRKTPWRWKGESKKWRGWHWTRGMKPKHMFGNALKDKLSEIKKTIREGLKRGLK